LILWSRSSMNSFLLSLLFVSQIAAQSILPNAWICDWIGIQGANKKLQGKYRTLINHLNKDKTLKAQQNRVTTWIKTNAQDLPELKKRTILTAAKEVLIPNREVDSSEEELYDKKPKPVDAKVIENTIYNTKFWLRMRARDVALIKDSLKRIAPKISKQKLEEIEKIIWAEDKRVFNFYRPHYNEIKQKALIKVSPNWKRSLVGALMEKAEMKD
ncbi:hypothetical protein PFISCL1PPCAC_26717, partial [Pristionchus fissidentatus]